VGSGAEGRVFEAIDRENGQKVALKEHNDANTDSQERILRELDHPNIVKCYGTFTDKTTGKKFTVMEFMKDGSLLEKIKTHPDLSYDETIAILKQIAMALEYMEQKKVLHRDIALRNVLVKVEPDGKWTVKMGDFGLARQPNRPGSDEYEMITVLRPLPLNQIPPECTHTRRWNPKCEAWSFGVLMWELLSRGQTPYQGIQEEVFQFLEKGKRLERPKGCPDKLWRLMKQCWHQDPTQRPSFSDISLMLTDSPYSWMPATPKATSPRHSESPYAEMPAIPKIAKAPSLQQMMDALSAVDGEMHMNTLQKSASMPNVSEVLVEQEVAPKPWTPYQPLPVAPEPSLGLPEPINEAPVVQSEPVVEGPEPLPYMSAVEPAPVDLPAPVYEPPPPGYFLQPEVELPPVQPIPAFQAVPIAVHPIPVPIQPMPAPVQPIPEPAQPMVVMAHVPPPVYEPPASPRVPAQVQPIPVQVAPASPVQAPSSRPTEYSVFHDGVEHCAVESLTPDMTLEKARELLAEEVDFEIEKCNFFRTDTNQRVSFKQEKTFTVQKCTNNTFVIHLRTTATS